MRMNVEPESTAERGAMVTVLKAAAFGAAKHRLQRRKDAEASSYINHPLALANILASEGGVTDTVVLAAALLHDTVEDSPSAKRGKPSRPGPQADGVWWQVRRTPCNRHSPLLKEGQIRMQRVPANAYIRPLHSQKRY